MYCFGIVLALVGIIPFSDSAARSTTNVNHTTNRAHHERVDPGNQPASEFDGIPRLLSTESSTSSVDSASQIGYSIKLECSFPDGVRDFRRFHIEGSSWDEAFDDLCDKALIIRLLSEEWRQKFFSEEWSYVFKSVRSLTELAAEGGGPSVVRIYSGATLREASLDYSTVSARSWRFPFMQLRIIMEFAVMKSVMGVPRPLTYLWPGHRENALHSRVLHHPRLSEPALTRAALALWEHIQTQTQSDHIESQPQSSQVERLQQRVAYLEGKLQEHDIRF